MTEYQISLMTILPPSTVSMFCLYGLQGEQIILSAYFYKQAFQTISNKLTTQLDGLMNMGNIIFTIILWENATSETDVTLSAREKY